MDRFDLTCASASSASGWLFAGDRAGRILALPSAEAAAPAWVVDACAAAVTCVCVVDAERADEEPLVAAGSAGGELVVLRGDLELRRFRLGAAVRCVRHARHLNRLLLVGDAAGAFYGVTRYEILWKEKLPSVPSTEASLFPGLQAPSVASILPVKLLDVQEVESSYALVSTSQRALLLTHRGRAFSVIHAPSAITTTACCPQPTGDKSAVEDFVLAAGEEGVVYRLESSRDKSTPERPDFQLKLEPWATVDFPISKLLILRGLEEEATLDSLAWIAVGVYGEVTLFRGQKQIKQQDTSSNERLLVDVIASPTTNFPSIFVVYPDAIRRLDL